VAGGMVLRTLFQISNRRARACWAVFAGAHPLRQLQLTFFEPKRAARATVARPSRVRDGCCAPDLIRLIQCRAACIAQPPLVHRSVGARQTLPLLRFIGELVR
jgi:hypothetical protein